MFENVNFTWSTLVLCSLTASGCLSGGGIVGIMLAESRGPPNPIRRDSDRVQVAEKLTVAK